MIQIISVHDDQWSQIIEKAKEYDFYHTQSYHLLEQGHEPLLIVLNFEDGFIAMPIVVRTIEGTVLKDCTSVYGYAGPITNFNKDQITIEKAQLFQSELFKYFESQNIISAFSRLHPVINNDVFLYNFGIIKELNKTITIDLHLSPEEQWKQYRKSNKSEINQLRRKGYTVIEATTREEIDEFIAIYYETMRRVDASDMYFFKPDYFYQFLKNNCFQTKLLIAKKEGVITAGAIFTISKDIIQYHLAGTTEKFMHERPMKLILDEARLLGNSLKMAFLHLGGGVGGSDDDSLFGFKSGFSELRFQFRIWQLVVDEKKYQELCYLRFGKENLNTNYFPLYRAN